MNRLTVGAFAVILAPLVVTASGAGFDASFDDATMRVDFVHTGDATNESVSIDRIFRQGVWAGSRSTLIDPNPYGRYLVEMIRPSTGERIFSKGFDSFFGEYRTTAAAAEGKARAYHETVLLPYPKHPVNLVFTIRERNGTTRPLGEFAIDPTSIAVSTEPPTHGTIVIDAHVPGPPARTLDIAVIGEGYTAAESSLFEDDVERATRVLLEHEPFASHQTSISIRGVLHPSRESGCDEPTRGRYRDTAVGATFNSLGSERYLLTEDNRALRNIAANVPYDALVIMVNHDRYGGGGIYNLYCTFTAHSQWSDYLLVHEFGHSFAGLADEYYSSSVAYNDFYPKGYDPIEPNITALIKLECLKWKDLVADGTPIPTPWQKAEYDERDAAYQAERREMNDRIAEATRTGQDPAAIEELVRKEREHAAAHAEWSRDFLRTTTGAGIVGAFEGAGYSATGLYRPTLDCVMFSRRLQPYCPVCARAVERMIEVYTR